MEQPSLSELPREIRCQILENVTKVPDIISLLESDPETRALTQACIRKITLGQRRIELVPVSFVMQLPHLRFCGAQIFVSSLEELYQLSSHPSLRVLTIHLSPNLLQGNNPKEESNSFNSLVEIYFEGLIEHHQPILQMGVIIKIKSNIPFIEEGRGIYPSISASYSHGGIILSDRRIPLVSFLDSYGLVQRVDIFSIPPSQYKISEALLRFHHVTYLSLIQFGPHSNANFLTFLINLVSNPDTPYNRLDINIRLSDTIRIANTIPHILNNITPSLKAFRLYLPIRLEELSQVLKKFPNLIGIGIIDDSTEITPRRRNEIISTIENLLTRKNPQHIVIFTVNQRFFINFYKKHRGRVHLRKMEVRL